MPVSYIGQSFWPSRESREGLGKAVVLMAKTLKRKTSGERYIAWIGCYRYKMNEMDITGVNIS